MRLSNGLYLIGVDDTDNAESRGTGHCVRRLGELLASRGLAVVAGITRHQLLVDPRIPYTSHNSSACLTAEVDPARLDALTAACREYLLHESAPGADAGLCVAAWGDVGSELRDFGGRAKRQVCAPDEARALARAAGALLEGLTGSGLGIIGACAAVGLRAAGNDGRFLWLPGLRELNGVYTPPQLRAAAQIDSVYDLAGTAIPDGDRVDVGAWVRPILREGRSVLLVEPAASGDAEWRVAQRERIKALSS